MSALNFLSRLKQSGVAIELVEEQLKINAPPGVLTPALIGELKEKKEDIIRFLKKNVKAQEPDSDIEPVEEREYYPLSPAQKRMYFFQQMHKQSIAYNMRETIPLGKDVDISRLEEAFRRLIRRHESLRTTFYRHPGTGEPVQRVAQNVDFAIERIRQPETATAEETAARINGYIRPFDLTRAPMMRAGLITHKDGSTLVMDMHHIISDAASQEQLMREFAFLAAGRRLPEQELQYKDYAQWQNSDTRKKEMKRQEKYWHTQLAGQIPVLQLPTDHLRPARQGYEGKIVTFHIGEKETAKLKNLMVKHGYTQYTLLLAILNIQLAKLTGQEDIIVGTPVAGRNHADLQGIVGPFINTLAMRNRPVGQKTVHDFFREVNERTLEAFENQDTQFEDLVDHVAANRSTGRSPLFDIQFDYLTVPQAAANAANAGNTGKGTAEASTRQGGPQTIKFDMTWKVRGMENRMYVNVGYKTELFDEPTILKYITMFKTILSTSLDQPDRKIADIETITPEEKNRVLNEFNETDTKTYVLDKYLKPQPIGIQGDLYITVEGKPTEETIENPFIPGTRLISTGEIAKWQPGGTLRRLGKKENRCQIGDFTIQLEALEEQILKDHRHKNAVLLTADHQNGNTTLTVYTETAEQDWDKAELKETVARYLPPDVPPVQYIRLDAMPLNSDGTVDRDRLPKADRQESLEVSMKAKVEEKLGDIFAELLRVERSEISTATNFFDQGGTSLELIDLVMKIQEGFEVNVPITSIYHNPSVNEIAGAILSKNFSEDAVALLNRERPQKIFSFPPQIGYGIFYIPLAGLLNETSFYAFSFIEDVEGQERLDQYANIITETQPEGPYVLYGYSAGGKLAFQVAATLEKRGHEVSAIIIFDNYFSGRGFWEGLDQSEVERRENDQKAYYAYLDNLLEQMGVNFMREQIFEKTNKYMDYYRNITQLEKINANVYMVYSEDERDEKLKKCWEAQTNGTVTYYQGHGTHNQMLSPGYVEKNAGIVREVLTIAER